MKGLLTRLRRMGADTQEKIIGLREAKGKVKIFLETRSCGFPLRENGDATSFLLSKGTNKEEVQIAGFMGSLCLEYA